MIEFINNLGIDSTTGLIGLGLIVSGFFLIFAGSGIISIEKVTVKQGKATWMVGIVIVLIGGVLFYPDLKKTDDVADPAAGMEDVQPSQPLSNSEDEKSYTGWRTIQFALTDGTLWNEEDGVYSATGSVETIAWSEEIFQGDLEISLDISSSSSHSAANIVVFGNGSTLSQGNLIFTIASDLQAISADSIYEGAGGKYLFSRLDTVNLENQTHTVLISIIDRKASLFLDGNEITAIFLDDQINSEGRIGLLKYWEINDIEFSNIRVRE